MFHTDPTVASRDTRKVMPLTMYISTRCHKGGECALMYMAMGKYTVAGQNTMAPMRPMMSGGAEFGGSERRGEVRAA